MTARSYKGPQAYREVDGSEVFDNLSPRTIAELQTYPGMQERNIRAVDAEHVALLFYQQLRAGRRCSCWGKNENPSKVCEVCYGVGIVGGYQKFGTRQWVLDTTAPRLALNNVEVFVTKGEGPTVFGLAEGATQGEILTKGDFQGNWGQAHTSTCPPGEGPIDAVHSHFWSEADGDISLFIKTLAATTWVPLTKDNLNNLFTAPQLFDVKIELRRPSVEAQTPLFQHLMLRVFRTGSAATLLKANRPRGTHAQALSELGVSDEWSTERWWFNQTVPTLTDLDWFLDIARDIRWKAIDTDHMAPQNRSLSWDVSVRKVQDYEQPILNYPA